MLPTDLMDRIRQRAADPARRNDVPTAGETSFFGGAFKTVRFAIGGPPGGAGRSEPLPAPAAAEAITAAAAALGCALPEDLKQLYTSIADGGFGPGEGLAPLASIVARYRDLTESPPGEGEQTWPEQLLPINLTEPGADCYDLESGAIVLWDEESLADGPSDEVWQRSFRQDAPSLAAWLEAWLDRPPLQETHEQMMQEAMLEHVRVAIADIRAKTPEERAAMGLPEEGWEEVMFGHLGIDLSEF